MSGHKVIVSCAITGSIHVPSLTPYLPITPEQIAARRSRLAQPARRSCTCTRAIPRPDPRPPTPSSSRSSCRRSQPECDAVINITTGGGHGMSLDERTLRRARFQPELCSLNMGSMNFAHLPDGRRDQGLQARLGTRLPGDDAGLHLPQHLQGHRDRRGHARRARHPVRIRVLRRRPSLHPRPLPRSPAGQAAAVRAD